MAYARNQGTVVVVSAGNDSADLQHDNGEILEVDTDGDGELEEVVLAGGHWISLSNEAANVLRIAATGPIGYNWGEPGLEEPLESPEFYTNYGTNAVGLAAPDGDADLEARANGVPGSQYDLVFNTAFTGEDTDPDSYPEPPFTPSYDWKAGTSMAAPQMTAALIKSVDPDYNANQVMSTLRNTAEIPDGYDKPY